MTPAFINIGFSELIVLSIFTILPIILIIYCITDVLKRDFSGKGTDQILIFILLICAPLLGSIIYLTLLRKNYALKN